MKIRELFEHAQFNWNDEMNQVEKSSWENKDLENDASLDFGGVKPLYIWTDMFVYQFIQSCFNYGNEAAPHFVVSPRNPSGDDFKL